MQGKIENEGKEGKHGERKYNGLKTINEDGGGGKKKREKKQGIEGKGGKTKKH